MLTLQGGFNDSIQVLFHQVLCVQWNFLPLTTYFNFGQDKHLQHLFVFTGHVFVPFLAYS